MVLPETMFIKATTLEDPTPSSALNEAITTAQSTNFALLDPLIQPHNLSHSNNLWWKGDALVVMTVRLGLLFFFHLLSPPLPSTVRWTSSLRLFALGTVPCFPLSIKHALPSPLLYYLRVHQCPLMCTLCAPVVPASPRRCPMYHRTFCAHFRTP